MSTVCRPLDPTKFTRACQRVHGLMEVQVQPQTINEAMAKGLTDPMAIRWLAGIRMEFPDKQAAMFCLMRVIGVVHLAQKGALGPFWHDEHGVWSSALEVLAVARCDMNKGFDEADVAARLAKLEPPPAEEPCVGTPPQSSD